MNYLLSFFDRRLWSEAAPASSWLRWLQLVARYAFGLVRDLATGELNLRAMSLVYTTILAFVPMAFFAFAAAQLMGVHEDLEPILFGFLEPLGPRAEEITSQITDFLDNISGGLLAAFSMGLLLLTVFSMAQKVESSFNFVWRVDRPRGFARRVGEYTSVVVIGMLGMAVATALIASLSSNFLVRQLQESESIAVWIARFGDAIPLFVVIAAFTALYLFIPNTRVRLKPAMVGGIASGLLWTTSGYVFASLVVLSSRFTAIYSGFATVIFLMLWLYLSWLILLLGLQLAFYVQNPFYLRYGHRPVDIDNSARERLGMNIMLLIARDFTRPGDHWTAEKLAQELKTPRTLLEATLNSLMRSELLTETEDDRLIPARDIRGIRLSEVVMAVRGSSSISGGDYDDRLQAAGSIIQRIETAIESELGEQSLADLVDAD